ncbi:MAG: FAD-dependent oxidoreductase [Myxococcales bacterium]|nr:FAD-dependent oxidoreductase [Myxococcales bacterium]
MKVAIVGGGIAGLTAARRLVDAGLDCRVFDRGRSVGGRASTRRADDGGLQFDHGAQYFTARDPRFVAQVEAWRSRGVIETWNGRFGVANNGTLEPKEENPVRYVGVPSMDTIARDLADGLSIESEVRIARMQQRGGADGGSSTKRAASTKRLTGSSWLFRPAS